MDGTYAVKDRTWVSDVFIIREYFQKTLEMLSPEIIDYGNSLDRKMKVRRYITGTECSVEEYRAVEKKISSAHLRPSTRKLSTRKMTMFTPWAERLPRAGVAAELNCVVVNKHRWREAERAEVPQVYRNLGSSGRTPTIPRDGTPDMMPGEHAVIHVRIYFPFLHQLGQEEEATPKLHCSFEVVLLGYQTLADLRDLILCGSDVEIPGECSENPRRHRGPDNKEMYKSGFIFVENVFYNDMRCPDALDLSQVIREWAAEKGLPPSNAMDMEHARVDSIPLRLGYPYVYQHQGSCEHLVVFSSASLLTTDDVLDSNQYPIYSMIGKAQARYCCICARQIATWVTFENDRLPMEPGYFCTNCFYSYNYVDNKKIGNFRAYQYVDRSVVI